MKRFSRKMRRSFWTTFLCCVCAGILIGGIWMADRNTRAMGFPDHSPVFSVTRDTGQTRINVFGYCLTLPF